jgi:hypothetical protein
MASIFGEKFLGDGLSLQPFRESVSGLFKRESLGGSVFDCTPAEII